MDTPDSGGLVVRMTSTDGRTSRREPWPYGKPADAWDDSESPELKQFPPRPLPPADPVTVHLTYQYRQCHAFTSDGYEYAPEIWTISADVEAAEPPTEVHVGDVELIRLKLRTRDLTNPFLAARGMGVDWDDPIYDRVEKALIDPATGDLDERLYGRLDSLGSYLLILRSVRMSRAWQGFGLDMLITTTAMDKLDHGVRLAATHPLARVGAVGVASEYPAELPEDPEEREWLLDELSADLRGIGFEEFRDGVYTLDFSEGKPYIVDLYDTAWEISAVEIPGFPAFGF